MDTLLIKAVSKKGSLFWTFYYDLCQSHQNVSCVSILNSFFSSFCSFIVQREIDREKEETTCLEYEIIPEFWSIEDIFKIEFGMSEEIQSETRSKFDLNDSFPFSKITGSLMTSNEKTTCTDVQISRIIKSRLFLSYKTDKSKNSELFKLHKQNRVWKFYLNGKFCEYLKRKESDHYQGNQERTTQNKSPKKSLKVSEKKQSQSIKKQYPIRERKSATKSEFVYDFKTPIFTRKKKD